ncbi:glycerate kinase [Neisseriaceae bacterium ESL0693]|nr:glycerate kinase [Neisseriaceae bacterium ESL0693]
MITENQAVDFLKQIFAKTIDAASPKDKLTPFIPAQKPQGRTIILGAGKAAAAMVAEWERIWPQDYPPLEGIAVTRYGHSLPTRYISILEASHPVPDTAGQEAAKRLLRTVDALTPQDQVFFLLSGGASALMTLPATGITLADKQTLNQQLLHSGAPIEAINAVRKHLSAIKGGQLALAAAPAHITTLAISDVVGDDISSIGSGAAVADPTTLEEVKHIIQQFKLRLPPSIQHYLQHQAKETPKQLSNSHAQIIITPDQVLNSVKQWAKTQGVAVWYLGDRIHGEASEVAKVMAAIALHQQQSLNQTPLLILSGGETTVTLRHSQGRGGRNSEFLLALAIALQGASQVYALAADTDGIDGSEDNAGAWLTPETLREAQAAGINPQTTLEQHQAYDFFAATQQLLITGPTRTNINDLRALLVFPKKLSAA